MAPIDAAYKVALTRQALMSPELRALELYLASQPKGVNMQARVAMDDKNLYVIAFDPATGAARIAMQKPITKLSDGEKTALKSSTDRLIREKLAATFMPVLHQYYLRKYKNEAEAAKRLSVLRDQFGNVDPTRLYAELPKEARRAWTRLYRLYEQRARSGEDFGSLFESTGVPYTINTQEDLFAMPVGSWGMRTGIVRKTKEGTKTYDVITFRVNDTGDPNKDFVAILLEGQNASK